MLRELSIENLAVIERATADFGGKFNVFTGETGAGKSILIGGINAILGQRTTKDIVRTGAPKAVITALFDELPAGVRAKLGELGFSDEEDELVLMREISADGKSTARINGRTATAAMLREVGELLVDVHGQHENRILMSNDNQRDILDSYGGLEPLLEEYRGYFRGFSGISRQIKKLQSDNENRARRTEQLTAIIEELEELDLRLGEGDELESKLQQLRGNERLRSALYAAFNCLAGDEEEQGAIDLIRRAYVEVGGVTEQLDRAQDMYDRLGDILLDAEDLASMMLKEAGSDYSEEYAEKLADRVSALKHCKRKYNMEADELVRYLDRCRAELMQLDSLDGELESLALEKHRLAEEVKRCGALVTAKRKEAAERLSAEICEQLKFLDMPNVRIIIAISPDKITLSGMDSVEMLISANAGEEPKPLGRIASGGELSRIMLAIKSVLADNDDIPTLIFDEVDAGISGRAAQKVGVKLAETAQKRQVLCITHLAQIASKADNHLLIEKHTENGRTYTNLTVLDHEGRRAELARIIDGNGVSESSLQAAEEMLSGRV